MNHFIIGTAGHIDHGKTSLVRALTGTDTDRLKEEKERNITIDIGFAFLGDDVTIIDVPGHEKFIKNMVTGVSTIDFVLFVIAADDGIMPQTKEHLDILRLLQIKDGIIILSKADKVEEDWIELVSDEVSEYMKGSFLEDAEIVVTDSLSGKGIDRIKQIINEKKKKKIKREDKGILRLPIDRVFSVKGFGTIITGTVLSGQVKEGDNLVIQPIDKVVKVRGLESHGKKVKQLKIGDRAAINISGVSNTEVNRGDILSSVGYLTPTYMVDAKFFLLSNYKKDLKNRDRVRVHAGTNEVFGRVAILDKEKVKSGEEAYIQIRLEEEMSLSPKERYVLRTYSPQVTIGGGSIIRPVQKKSKRFDKELLTLLKELEKGQPEEVVEEILLQSKLEPFNIQTLAKKLAKTDNEVKQLVENLLRQDIIISIGKGKNSLYFHRINIGLIGNNIISQLEKFHKANPFRPGISKAEVKNKISKIFNPALLDFILNTLEKDNVNIVLNTISLKTFEIELTDELNAKINSVKSAFKNMGFKPDPLNNYINSTTDNYEPGEFKELLGMMLSQNEIIKITEEMYIEKSNFEFAKKAISEKINTSGEIKLGEVSTILDSSRKFMVPFMEYLDKIKFTVRSGDARVLY